MAITVTGYNTADVTYTGGTATYTNISVTPSNGDYVIIWAFNDNNRDFSTITIGGQNFTAFPNNPLNDVFADHGSWYRKWTGAESDTTVTITLSGGASGSIGACVVAGLAATQSTPQGAVLNDSGTPATSHSVGSVTPATTSSIVVGSSQRGNRTWTNGGTGSWTDIGTTSNLFSFVYQVRSDTNAVTYTINTSDSAAAATMTLGVLDGAAAGGSSAKQLATLGVG